MLTCPLTRRQCYHLEPLRLPHTSFFFQDSIFTCLCHMIWKEKTLLFQVYFERKFPWCYRCKDMHVGGTGLNASLNADLKKTVARVFGKGSYPWTAQTWDRREKEIDPLAVFLNFLLNNIFDFFSLGSLFCPCWWFFCFNHSTQSMLFQFIHSIITFSSYSPVLCQALRWRHWGWMSKDHVLSAEDHHHPPRPTTAGLQSKPRLSTCVSSSASDPSVPGTSASAPRPKGFTPPGNEPSIFFTHKDWRLHSYSETPTRSVIENVPSLDLFSF